MGNKRRGRERKGEMLRTRVSSRLFFVYVALLIAGWKRCRRRCRPPGFVGSFLSEQWMQAPSS